MSLESPPRARRPLNHRVVAGVAAGLAAHLRLPVWLVRLGFVVFTFVSGLGIVLYAAFWAVLPLEIDPDDPRADDIRSSDTTRLLALAAIVAGVALLLTALGVNVFGGVIVPLLVAVFGAALIWRQLDDERRGVWTSAASKAARQTAGSAARAGRWRIVIGIGLVVLAVIALITTHTSTREALRGGAIAFVILVGIGIVAFPWIYRRWREQQDQHRELIRSQERAEIASHVHDSVLQTLTLIQRYAYDPHEVVRLARTEERALRGWLYAPKGDPARTFAAAMTQAASDVEGTYAASIDVVTVGDVSLNDDLTALIAASREAMVNAARHGGGSASVFAETDGANVEVFVRDRGAGFDVMAVPDDRHGVRESIIGRMERHHGTATVRSTPGSGTEVRLRMSLVGGELNA